ncbi:phage terminase large subunit [Sulfitobacter sediminilitoris]|nr:phage terminase large subunit [Sulfitobacter sediminilitoris]
MSYEPDQAALFEALMRRDLSSFIQRSFLTVDPGSQYLHGWHVDAIAHKLQQVAAGQIKRLVITMPPRSLKSIAASVAFPAWLLGRDPRLRVLAVSYGEGLSEKLAMDCMKVIEAPWYRACFPRTRIARGRGARSDFETTRGGGRFSTSVGGTLTGRGGDIILIDDPHKPEEAASEAKRLAVKDWFKSTLLSRLNDPRESPIVLIQQRVHEDDLAGMVLEQGNWQHLNLPAIAEEVEEIALGRGRVMNRDIGDLLHPERLPRDLLARLQKDLGSYVFAAQYQQRPAPLGGGLVKWNWFQTYDRPPDRTLEDRIIQSWDTASKAEEVNDHSVCTTWLVRGSSAWLLEVFRAQLEFPELRRAIEARAHAHSASLILIEEAGSGVQLIQDLRRSGGLNIRGIIPKGDKQTRLLGVTPLIESGKVAIPKNAPWLATFQHEVILFPKGKHDDQVDSLSQFLIWLGEPVATAMSGTVI